MSSVNSQPVFLESFDLFVNHVKGICWNDLPGLEAQLKMAPLIRREEIGSMGQGLAPVKSSVLFLFYPMEGARVGTVFIQRPVYRGSHSGQISFPGGRYEETDPDLQYTALRETYEEVGVPADAVEVVGRLSNLFIPPSNFMVSPFLGVTYQRPRFVPDPLEVDEILEVELAAFFDPRNRVMKTLDLSTGFSLQTPCFSINGYTIWGATAMMISEFLEVIRKG